MWTFATLPFRATFEGPDLLAIVEAVRALGWALDEYDDEPLMWLDGEELPEVEELAAALGRAQREVLLGYDRYPRTLKLDLVRRAVQAGNTDVSIDMTRLAEQLGAVPFEVASFGSRYQTAWDMRVAGDPHLTLAAGHDPMGWAVAFRGRGHERFPSRRWLETGPWKVWTGPEDVTVVQLHALDADASTALAQAAPGYQRFKTRDATECEPPAWARGPAFDFGEIELGEIVRSGTGDAVHRGRSKRDGNALLVTVTNGHRHDPARDAASYALPFAGIAPLLGLGNVAGQRFGEALVEVLPPGRPAVEFAPIDEKRLAVLGMDIAKTVERARVLVDGIQPELIYVDDEATFTGLVPRGPRFIATAATFAAGPRSYPVPYVGPECVLLGTPSTRATDVFALCASLFMLATGRHPFGAIDDVQQIMMRMMSNQPETLPGPLGEVLAKGLAAEPATRPSMLQLASWFGKLA